MSSPLPKVRASHTVFVAGPEKAPQDATFVHDYSIDALLASEGHYRLRSGKWSGGGPFFVYHESKNHGSPGRAPASVGPEDGSWGFSDVWHPKGVSMMGAGYPGLQALLDSAGSAHSAAKRDLPSYYATGYARARPGNPQADAFQFLAELRDLPVRPFKGWLKGTPLRRIPESLYRRLWDFKRLGNEYLNIVFGWKPFLNDLRKFYHLYKGLDKILAKLYRENGKSIRRRATVLQETSVTGDSWALPYPWVQVLGPPPGYAGGTTSFTYTRRETKRVWFSGGFRYYIPDVGSPQWTRRATLALFGVNPTPASLWAILPWSWLIDWFSNVGDVMSNLSQNAVDNLVSEYSYIMCESAVTEEATVHVKTDALDNILFRIPAHEHTYCTTKKVVTKARVGGGNPYGLNVQLGDLSLYQLSILGALGISRSRLNLSR